MHIKTEATHSSLNVNSLYSYNDCTEYRTWFKDHINKDEDFYYFSDIYSVVSGSHVYTCNYMVRGMAPA